MKNRYYMTDLRGDKLDFVKENFQYVTADNLFEKTVLNKFTVEHGFVLEKDSISVKLQHNLNQYDHDSSLCYLDEVSSYEHVEALFQSYLEKKGITEEEYKYFTDRDYIYSGHTPFTKIDVDKHKITDKINEYHLSCYLSTMLMLLTGEVHDDLGAALELMKKPGSTGYHDSYRACEVSEFEFSGLKVKTFKNGKVELTNCPDNLIKELQKLERIAVKICPYFDYTYNEKLKVEKQL